MPTELILYLAVEFATYTGASSLVATMAATFAVSFAASTLVTRVFGQDPPTQVDSGVRQQIPPSSTNSLPVVYGDAYLGGVFVDAVLSIDQKTMYYVLAISNISPNGQFSFDTTKFYYGDRLVTFDNTDLTRVVSLTDGVPNVDTKVNGYLYINLYTSDLYGTISSPNSAPPPSVVMGGTDIATAQQWSSGGRQMTGLAFAIVKMVYSQSANTTSFSPLTFHVAHYLNGAGCAKPGDVLQDYLVSPIYGGAVLNANVNATTCANLNTYSDVLLSYTPSGGGTATQPRYRINGVLDTGQTVLNNVDKILTACDSWLAYQSTTGQWSPVINKAESSTNPSTQQIAQYNAAASQVMNMIIGVIPVDLYYDLNGDGLITLVDSIGFLNLASGTTLGYTPNPASIYTYIYNINYSDFDDTTILSEIKITAQDLTASINQIEVSYPFKDNKDQPAFIYQQIPTLSLYPNEPVNKFTTKFEMVNNSVQAAYLANRILLQSRTDLIVNFSTAYPGIQNDAGDVITITNADYGWSAKPFRITKIQEAALADGNLGAQITATEYDATVYANQAITATTPAPANGVTSPYFFSALAAPTIGNYLPNANPPTFAVTCVFPTTGRCTSVTLYYTTSTTPTATDWAVWITQTSAENTAYTPGSSIVFNNIILPTANYYFAFQVSNDIATSALSATSAVTNWNPGSSGGVVNGFSPNLYAYDPMPGTASAILRFTPDGTIQENINSGGFTTIGNWFLPTTTNVGATPGYWLYATVTVGTLTSGSTGTWIKMDVVRDYTLSTSSGIHIASLDFSISSSSSGTPVEGYGTGYLEVEVS